MAPTNENFREIAEQAEKDLNSYGSKTGANKNFSNDDAGVDTGVERKFPGSEVKYGDDLSTNAGYNKRIPPEEGGDTDDRGRQTRGEHFEGVGGPEDKLAAQERDYGGYNSLDSTGRNQPTGGTSSAADDPVSRTSQNDVMLEGKEAVRSNVENTTHAPRKDNYKGEDWFTPESVPGSASAEGYEPPESVTQASRDV